VSDAMQKLKENGSRALLEEGGDPMPSPVYTVMTIVPHQSKRAHTQTYTEGNAGTSCACLNSFRSRTNA
jgi:hypothetical protein